MKGKLLLILLTIATAAKAQSEYAITVESRQPSGIIDEMLYGQLFEHIAGAVSRHSSARRIFRRMVYGRRHGVAFANTL